MILCPLEMRSMGLLSAEECEYDCKDCPYLKGGKNGKSDKAN